jgi:gamma-glutamyltranspeptidase
MGKVVAASLGLSFLASSAQRASAVPLANSPASARFSKTGMVVSEQRTASEIGAQVLASGGNAVDAAVAVGCALAVIDPCCGNLGGGGFMLIHLANGKETFLDFRETAPSRATRDMFLDAAGNDEMDDFTAKPGVPNQYKLVQGSADAIAPGKRPLSSMSPTIVSRSGKPFLVVGSPGGPRIITSTLGVIQNVVDYGMSLQQAVDAPRFHSQWKPDIIEVEPDALSRKARATLGSEGYTLKEHKRWGVVEAILINPADGRFEGVSDRRRPSGAAVAP